MTSRRAPPPPHPLLEPLRSGLAEAEALLAERAEGHGEWVLTFLGGKTWRGAEGKHLSWWRLVEQDRRHELSRLATYVLTLRRCCALLEERDLERFADRILSLVVSPRGVLEGARMQKWKRSGAAGGRRSKKLAGVLAAARELLAEAAGVATAKQLFAAFPGSDEPRNVMCDGREFEVYRDGDALFQEGPDGKIRSVRWRTFRDRYSPHLSRRPQ